MVLPIDDCDARPVGISRRLNAQITLVALSKLQHPLICFLVLGMIHVSVDRCENDCVVGRLGSLRDERHDSILLTCACVRACSETSTGPARMLQTGSDRTKCSDALQPYSWLTSSATAGLWKWRKSKRGAAASMPTVDVSGRRSLPR